MMVGVVIWAGTLLVGSSFGGQNTLSPQEAAIEKEMSGLRSLPDKDRGAATRKIAIEIRNDSGSPNQAMLATGLANLATEGDFGFATIQEVATTLAYALSKLTKPEGFQMGFDELALLVRYEHVKVGLRSPMLKRAIDALDKLEQARSRVDFSLKDLDGKTWTLSKLKGKVVLVNFWATWCPPCRKEMPDLDKLYEQYRAEGLVVLAISDEKAETVQKYLGGHPVNYPVLLDPGRKVNTDYQIGGIPNSYLYSRDGKLAAVAEDMRTRGQFLRLLAKAGLKVSTAP